MVRLLIGLALLAICLTIHASGLIALELWLIQGEANSGLRFGKDLWLLIRMAWAIVLLHGLEIAIWAGFYWWKNCMPDFSTAYYFSSITYTTVGYGDLVLPVEWRNLSGVEALTGIMMGGLSTSFFFVVLSRAFNGRQ